MSIAIQLMLCVLCAAFSKLLLQGTHPFPGKSGNAVPSPARPSHHTPRKTQSNARFSVESYIASRFNEWRRAVMQRALSTTFRLAVDTVTAVNDKAATKQCLRYIAQADNGSCLLTQSPM